MVPEVVNITGSVPTSGGLLTVTGRNFGGPEFLSPEAYLQKDGVVLPLNISSNVTTDALTDLQSVSFRVLTGFDAGWTLVFSVAGQVCRRFLNVVCVG
jgi:hypothetical protein